MERPRFGQSLFRHTFVPALLVLSLAPWLAFDRSTGWGFTSTTRLEVTGPMLLLVMLVVWMAEQLYPANADWNARLFTDGLRGWKRLGHDLVYLFGVAQLSAFLVGRLDPLLAAAVGKLDLWPAQAPFAARVALAFFTVEFFAYWVHRAAHRFRPLWQFHSTHHVITELNGLKAVRTHPVDNVVAYVGRVVPLMLLGAGPSELQAAIYFGGVLGILSHANLTLSDRGLGLLVNFPSAHAAHHASDVAEANVNFGCHTVLWDRVFGTFRRAARPGATLGVDPVGPRTLWQQLAWPFYRRVGGL